MVGKNQDKKGVCIVSALLTGCAACRFLRGSIWISRGTLPTTHGQYYLVHPSWDSITSTHRDISVLILPTEKGQGAGFSEAATPGMALTVP